MNILFIGDIIGRAGRGVIKELLPELKQEYALDFVVANGENLASGFGMTYETYQEMIDVGIDYFTSGNHIWAKKDFLTFLDDKKIKVLRPANYPSGAPGRGVDHFNIKNKDVYLINLLGQVFTEECLNNPFTTINEIIKRIPKNKIILVDFHAEATSEKNTLGYYLDGRVTAIVGTHTHVATSDYRILPKGTAYITDIGMTGPLDSSIGIDLKPVTQHFLTGLPFKAEIAKGQNIFSALLLNIDDSTSKVQDIKYINKII